MEKRKKKVIAYIAAFSYLLICTGVLYFGDFVINKVLSIILLVLLLPGSFISIAFAFFGGAEGQIIGVFINFILAVLLIEIIFKKPRLSN